jgi:hypothetical protein
MLEMKGKIEESQKYFEDAINIKNALTKTE